MPNLQHPGGQFSSAGVYRTDGHFPDLFLTTLSPKAQCVCGGGLKSAAYFRLVGIPWRIRALIHEDVDDLFQRINPCLRAVSAAMTKTAGDNMAYSLGLSHHTHPNPNRCQA